MFSSKQLARDEYCLTVADNVDEAKKLIEAGFEFVCSHNDTMLAIKHTITRIRTKSLVRAPTINI